MTDDMLHKTMIQILCGMLVLEFACAQGAEPVKIHAETVAEFVSSEEGRKCLQADDVFTTSLGPLERQLRLQSDAPVSAKQLNDFIAAQVLDWDEPDVQTLKSVLADFSAKSKNLKLPFPKRVQFVRTTGKEEGDAAYCRGTAVIVPTRLLDRDPMRVSKTIKHELFHVISNQNPMLRDRMYKVIGFHRCAGFDYPSELKARRITNPDAPRLEHYIKLQNTDSSDYRKVIPILFSKKAAYDGGNLFAYLQFRLQVIEITDGKATAVIRNGVPQLLDPKSEPSYLRQIGNNTGYIIHPEEILADNFVAMIDGMNVPNPEIVESLRDVFDGAESQESQNN